MGNEESAPPTPESDEEEVVWYKSKRFCKAVKKFHDKYAQEPSETMEQARSMHNGIINDINNKLKADKKSLRIEFTGSSYEGVKVRKVDDDDLEFDVMVIMDVGETEFDVLPIRPGFVHLMKSMRTWRNESFNYYDNTDDGEYLSPNTIKNKFHGILEKYINTSEEMKGKVKLKYHGPASQMDVYYTIEDFEHKSKRLKFYSVDVVPTYEIGPNKELYIAKPEKGEHMASAWRRSFSLDEKEKFRTMDSDGGCRKQVLRVLKVIRHRSDELKSLTSFHLKMALFAEVDDRHVRYDWTQEKLGERLIDLIRRLHRYLNDRCMPHYYMKDVNLLRTMKDETIDLIRNRLKVLRDSEKEWLALLKINEEEEPSKDTSDISVGAAAAVGLTAGLAAVAIGGIAAYYLNKDNKRPPDDKK